MMKCPSCNNEIEYSENMNYCPECGWDLNVKVEIHTCDFSDDEKMLIDKIKFFLNKEIPADGKNDGKNVIRASGDVVNVPTDASVSIVTLGNVSFAESKSHGLKVGYDTDCCKEAAFKETAIIRRVSEDSTILIKTDIATYKITNSDLDSTRMRTFSRKPIILHCHKGSVYMICDLDRDYVFDDGDPLDSGSIHRIAIMKKYTLSGNRAYFRVD